MKYFPISERFCAKLEHCDRFCTPFSLVFDGNDRQPPLPKQSKQSKNQYHTNTTFLTPSPTGVVVSDSVWPLHLFTFLTTFPKRMKKVVNTTPIPVNNHHCAVEPELGRCWLVVGLAADAEGAGGKGSRAVARSLALAVGCIARQRQWRCARPSRRRLRRRRECDIYRRGGGGARTARPHS